MFEKQFSGDAGRKKDIFVFLDGTKNNAASDTSVRRVFDALYQANDPQAVALYIEGVGTVENPLLGALLGFGMEPRILRGYDFISQSYRPGDKIYIFGFSRGAHQARALAGLIAYAGLLPPTENDQRSRLAKGNAVLERVKRENDEQHQCTWGSWQPGAAPLLSENLRTELAISTTPAEITFLGIWDTVPGSFFKDYGVCKEMVNRRDGDRYKSDSYPPIRHIVHAVSMDEKRSRFAPILVCPALNAAATTIDEEWFPGAHADVGGGYPNSRDLPNLSLQWMMKKLAQSYPAAAAFAPAPPDPHGLAHWSMGDWPANWWSDCQDRAVPAGAIKHGSVAERAGKTPALIRIKGDNVTRPYPLSCIK